MSASFTTLDRLTRLLEAEASLKELTKFNRSHPGYWTAEELAEQSRLRIRWTEAADAFFAFDRFRSAAISRSN